MTWTCPCSSPSRRCFNTDCLDMSLRFHRLDLCYLGDRVMWSTRLYIYLTVCSRSRLLGERDSVSRRSILRSPIIATVSASLTPLGFGSNLCVIVHEFCAKVSTQKRPASSAYGPYPPVAHITERTMAYHMDLMPTTIRA
jgi:hypothetical protein